MAITFNNTNTKRNLVLSLIGHFVPIGLDTIQELLSMKTFNKDVHALTSAESIAVFAEGHISLYQTVGNIRMRIANLLATHIEREW